MTATARRRPADRSGEPDAKKQPSEPYSSHEKDAVDGSTRCSSSPAVTGRERPHRNPSHTGIRSQGDITHVVGDQSAVIAFLSDPRSYGLDQAFDPVERIDTHGAIVFLAGTRAYKLKRAVCFPFMDLSTLARREEACKAEIAINKPLAPEIYIDAVAITRGPSRELTINGQGEAIDWAVEMHRFDTGQTFDQLAAANALDDDDLDKAIDVAVAFQARAPERRASDWIADLGGYIEHNDQAFLEAPAIFSRPAVSELTARTIEKWKSLEPLLLQRGQAQRVRRAHGDMHLRNIVKLKDSIRLFDAIEFDDRIATGDVLYDLAFLLMDLDHLGLRDKANRALNRYLSAPTGPGDLDGLAALPFYMSMRAALRAKICAMSAAHQTGTDAMRSKAEARNLFTYAADMLEPRDLSLTVIGGLSGTGKSRLAQALAPRLGCSPGAVIIRSDIVRKSLLESRPEEKLGPSAYQRSVSQTVYAEMARQAAVTLEAGQSVVVDAVFATAQERQAIEDVALAAECHFAAVWLDAPLETRLARVEKRFGDASDADSRVVALQQDYDLGVMDWPLLDSSGSFEKVCERVRRAIDRLN